MKYIFFSIFALATLISLTTALPVKAADTWCCKPLRGGSSNCNYTSKQACENDPTCATPQEGTCSKQQATPPGNTGGSGAQQGTFGPADTQEFNFTNPLQCDDATCLVKRFVDQLNKVALGILVIIVLWSAIQFAIAYPTGNEKQIESAKKTLLYAAIGYTIILLAKGVTDIIDSIFK